MKIIETREVSGKELIVMLLIHLVVTVLSVSIGILLSYWLLGG